MSTDPPPINPDPIQQRLSQLEKENAQLRADVQDMTQFGVGGQVLPRRAPNAPFFRPLLFQRKLGYLLAKLLIPMFLINFLPVLVQLPALRGFRNLYVGGMRVVDFAGIGTWHPGIGFGLISFGGLGCGVIAIGGLSVGVLAFGGGAIGLLAMGGGSIGLIAIGGGGAATSPSAAERSVGTRWRNVEPENISLRAIGRIRRRLSFSLVTFRRFARVCSRRCR